MEFPETDEEAVLKSKEMISSIEAYIDDIKKARDKVYCHLDKDCLVEESISILLNKIEIDKCKVVIDKITNMCNIISAHYQNSSSSTKYMNQNDITRLIGISEDYSKYRDNILELKREEYKK